MRRSILTLLAAGLLGAVSAVPSQAAECIAPANPGGGWDFTCRQIGKIMFDIGAVDKPIQVTNMAGAGGGLAYNHVVAERGSDADLIIAASSATSTAAIRPNLSFRSCTCRWRRTRPAPWACWCAPEESR